MIAIGTGLYAGLGGMREWRESSNDLSFARLAYHDLRVDLSEGSYVRAGRLERALSALREQGIVRIAEERMIVPTQVDASRAGRTVLVPGQIVGIAHRYRGSDRLWAGPGRTLRPRDARTDVTVLDLAFARHYGLPASGTVRIPRLGERPLCRPRPVAAVLPRVAAPASSAARRRSRSCTRRCAPRSGRPDAPAASTSCLCGSLPGADVDAGERQVRAALAQALPGVGTTVTRGTEERAYRVLYDDARSDQRILNVFAFLVLGGAAFAAFNLISRVVESERREIGVGMALGVPPRALALRPLLMGAQIALLGTALGIAIGVGFAGWLTGVFEDQLPLPAYAAAFRTEVFLVGAALGFLLPLAATAYPVWRGVRVAPIEAIRVGFRAAKGGGFAPLLKRIRLPGLEPRADAAAQPRPRASPHHHDDARPGCGDRHSRRPCRGMFDSFRGTVDGIEEEALHESPARLDVLLNGFHRRDGRTCARDRALARRGRAPKPASRCRESCAPAGSRSTSPSGSSTPEAASGRRPSAQARSVAAARGS